MEGKKEKLSYSRKTLVLWSISSFIVALILGFGGEHLFSSQFSTSFSQDSADSTNAITCDRENGAYQYTNPLLLCNSPENTASAGYQALKNQVSAFIQQTEAQTVAQSGNQESVSVYFQDLNSGDWFGINQDDQYSPASLLKVPIMIAYYKEAQTDPTLLSSTLTYSGVTDSNSGEFFKSASDIAPGTYSVSDLINSMIANSDNNALDLLSQSHDQTVVNQLYSYLGVPTSQSTSADFMTAKLYAQFFRILYNATYLSKANSEKALELLISADFPQGLRGGTGAGSIPASVPIAQKFGERTDQYPDGVVEERELHDCGIVYDPGDPYLLCVMTKTVIGDTETSGSASAQADFGDLSAIIEGVSKIVYRSAAVGASGNSGAN